MKKIYLFSLLTIFSLNLFCQIHWTKHPDNPVMVPGSAGEWDAEYVAPGSVIYYDNLYHMWYNGTLTNSRIGYAASPDGITWTKDENNPVLSVGQPGAWDENNVQQGYVLKTDTLFHMWYTGHSGTVWNANYQIGHATSTDGIIWIKDTINNPVLSMGPDGDWDDKWLYGGPVIFDGIKLHTWYTAWGGEPENVRIGHATSTDGITWTKDTQNPVVSFEAGKWDYPRAEGPVVIFDGLTYHMWYGGGESGAVQIGYATSADGSVWTKYENNPVLSPGTRGSWDDKWISAGAVIDSAGVKYKMWYVGGQTDETGSIGYAESNISDWEQMETMPQATSWYGSCIETVSEKAYFFGGQAPSPSDALSLLSTTQIYDFKTDTWSSGSDMPEPASSFSAEMVNGKIYIIGEFLNPRKLTNVLEYDPVNDTWTTKAQLPEIFYAHGTCVYNGLIYSFGGRDANFNLINTVRTYDPLTDTWNDLQDMPYKRDNPAVCVYKDEIYLFGGNPSLKYTPSTNTWTELNSGECEIIAYAAPIIDGNRIILFGGYKEGSYPVPSNEIWVYCPDNDSFVRYESDMPFDRFTEGYKYNSNVYLFGGNFSNTVGSVTDEVWKFNFSTITDAEPAWKQMKSMDIAKGTSQSCVIDDLIYVFGGNHHNSALNSSEVYNTNTNEWMRLAPIPLGLAFTNAGMINGKIYLAGGWSRTPHWFTVDDTYEYNPVENSWDLKENCPKQSGGNASCVLNDKLYLFGGLKDFPENDITGQKDVLVYDPATDTWDDSLPEMIYERGLGAHASVYDDQIYVFGGSTAISGSESYIIAKVEKYDPVENTWLELPEMPVQVTGHISLVYNEKLYVFGGDSTNNLNSGSQTSVNVNIIQEYDPATNQWQLMEPMPFNLSEMAGQKVGNYLYLFGGYPENVRDFISALDEVWRFNLDSLKEFVTTPEDEPAWVLMNTEDPGVWTCIVDTLIYSFGGGWEGRIMGDDVKSYNTVTNEWKELTPIPMPWIEGGIGLIGDKIYLAGGYTDDWVFLDSVFEYDLSQDNWTSKNKCPFTIGSNAYCVKDNKLHIMGGWGKFSQPQVYHAHNAMSYDPANDLWDTQSLPDMNYPHLMHATAEVLDGNIYVIGGAGLPPDYKVQPSEKFDGEQWVPIAKMPHPVTLHKSIVHNNKIIVFGGDSLWTQSHGSSTNFIQEYDPATDTWTIMEPMPFQRSGMMGGKVGNYVFLMGGAFDDRDPTSYTNEIWRFNLDSLKAAGTVGIAKTKVNQTVLIYPNPANDVLYLKVPVQFQDEFDVKMFNVTGKMIFHKAGYIQQIDISGIPPGVYLISVKSKDFVNTKKIIKQ